MIEISKFGNLIKYVSDVINHELFTDPSMVDNINANT